MDRRGGTPAEHEGPAPSRHNRLVTRAGYSLLGALVGVAAGAVLFTFDYGRGASYLHDDPEACANCHVMEAQYAAWTQGSHRAVATCNDCHTPKPLVGKYLTKAQNGFLHSFAFTTGAFPEPIRIKPFNRAVTDQRCRDCHASVVQMIAGGATDIESCVRCHADVGHPG